MTDSSPPDSSGGPINRSAERQSPASEQWVVQPLDVSQDDNSRAAGGRGHIIPDSRTRLVAACQGATGMGEHMTREIGPELVARLKRFADSLEAIVRGEVDSPQPFATPQANATPGEGSVPRSYEKSDEKRVLYDTNHDAVPEATAYADGEPAPKCGGETGLNPRDGTGNTTLDIVARLRCWFRDVNAVSASDLMDEAADEIERMRRVITTKEKEQ